MFNKLDPDYMQMNFTIEHEEPISDSDKIYYAKSAFMSLKESLEYLRGLKNIFNGEDNPEDLNLYTKTIILLNKGKIYEKYLEEFMRKRFSEADMKLWDFQEGVNPTE